MSEETRNEHPLVQLARRTIETYVRQGRVLSPPAELAPEMQGQAGTFVSLHRQGQLRGCIGTFAPTQPTVAEEVIHNAIAAATGDPRFYPVQSSELADLEISVDVLSAPEPVKDESELDPHRYGVIVAAGRRRGLLLPDLEGVDSAEMQIDICRQKAGIASNEPVQLSRFTVQRYR